MRIFLSGLLCLLCLNTLIVSVAAAESNTVAVIHEDGDLAVIMYDNPNSAPPHDGANFWGALLGTENDKAVETESVKIKCQSLITEPLKMRFGTCRIEIKGAKVSRSQDRVATLISGTEAEQLLKAFTGAEQTEWPRAQDWKFANGKIWLTADHPRKLFAFSVDAGLFQSK